MTDNYIQKYDKPLEFGSDECEEKFGISFGSGWVTDKMMFQITAKDNDVFFVLVIDKKVVFNVKAPNHISLDRVKEFKPTKCESYHEKTQHRVWILTKDGNRKCPWCGQTNMEYDNYNDPRYLSDHRIAACLLCNRAAHVSHDHINGVCQDPPPGNMKYIKKVEFE